MIISQYIVGFVIFSFFGWVWESFYCMMNTGKWENRGFLFGPYCPIYGLAVMIAYFIFTAGLFPVTTSSSPLTVFLICMFGSAIIEYITSYILEKKYHARWWDYSKLPFNIKGRIALPISIAFGLAGIVVVRYLLPLLQSYKPHGPSLVIEGLSLFFVFIMSTDFGITLASLSEITNRLNEVENVGKVKDIADETKVNAVEMRPAVPQDIKVIKMEVINPLAELNNSMNTNKTSDIVKFIDANLSTDNIKKSKTSSSKASEAAKKSSAEKSIKMTEADAKFFNNLIEVNQQVIEGTKTADQTNNNLLKDVEAAKSAQVSKTLLNALKESQETNKAFRVDFDKDISVVLRVNKDGQISAEFLPGDEAVEQYLKANIPLLKQKFTDEGLEYDNLSYRQHKKDNEEEKQRQQRGNKKENGYE